MEELYRTVDKITNNTIIAIIMSAIVLVSGFTALAIDFKIFMGVLVFWATLLFILYLILSLGYKQFGK